jgi:hypothetical protein
MKVSPSGNARHALPMSCKLVAGILLMDRKLVVRLALQGQELDLCC